MGPGPQRVVGFIRGMRPTRHEIVFRFTGSFGLKPAWELELWAGLIALSRRSEPDSSVLRGRPFLRVEQRFHCVKRPSTYNLVGTGPGFGQTPGAAQELPDLDPNAGPLVSRYLGNCHVLSGLDATGAVLNSLSSLSALSNCLSLGLYCLSL